MADTDSNTAAEGGRKSRGRPKAAVVEKVDKERDTSPDDEPKAKRGRGRPKGSTGKGRKKSAPRTPSANAGATGGKRGRGRPRKDDKKSAKDDADSDGGDKDD